MHSKLLAGILTHTGEYQDYLNRISTGGSIMSIVVTPDSFDVGAMCTATLRWEGGPPNPNDAHMEAQHDDGSWHVVIDMPTIPGNQNPANGFDIRFSSGNPNVGGPGRRHFRVRWTWDGKDRDMTEDPVLLGDF